MANVTGCVGCGSEVSSEQNFCPRCGECVRSEKAVSTATDGGWEIPLARRATARLAEARPRHVHFLGRMAAGVIGGATMMVAGIVAAALFFVDGPQKVTGGDVVAGAVTVTATQFGESADGVALNPSSLASIGDSRFLFADRRASGALFEFAMAPDGRKDGPVIRHAISGLVPILAGELQATTTAEAGGRRYIFATSSHGDLVRVTLGEDGSMAGELIPDFRAWVLDNYAAALDQGDAGGTSNAFGLEGIAWDPARGALLFGVRSPDWAGDPVILPVGIRDIGGVWRRANLVPGPVIHLKVDQFGTAQRIRSIERNPATGEFLLIVGDADPEGKVPFRMYMWNGVDQAQVRKIENVWFDPAMKPEDIAFGSIDGKNVVVVMDENGGYGVVWEQDFRER